MTTHTQPKPAGTPTWVDLTTPELDAARSFYHAIFGWDYDIHDGIQAFDEGLRRSARSARRSRL